ncbi:MAG: OsmC family protein [Planctomycetes bacterium]|nr:OsmC family protein [Planctomycetota bacterium]
MRSDELRNRQAPIKARYRADPASAVVTLRARGQLDVERTLCRVKAFSGDVESGLHPAAGGPAGTACSGDMLLDALVACAGVTLCVVATAMEIPLRGGTIEAEGELDFRGTLGVDRAAPIGITRIDLRFTLDSDAPAERLDKLLQLVERHCVIYQTLCHPPRVSASWRAAAP